MDKYDAQAAMRAMKTAEATPIKSVRQQALEEAINLTCGDRNKAYGPPYENLNRLANMVRAYMGDRPMSSFKAADMAAVNILIKLSRLATNPTHRDSWVDAAAYAGIGLECALTEVSVPQDGIATFSEEEWAKMIKRD